MKKVLLLFSLSQRLSQLVNQDETLKNDYEKIDTSYLLKHLVHYEEPICPAAVLKNAKCRNPKHSSNSYYLQFQNYQHKYTY